VIAVAFIASVILSPLFWYLWIFQGSGNANFFYSTTLLLATAQIFLVGDFVNGMLMVEAIESNPELQDKIENLEYILQ
jgi:phosphatidylinositol glycan class U